MAKNNSNNPEGKDATYRTLVSPGLMDELKEKISDILVGQKRYREKNFLARHLASEIGTNTRYLSAVVSVKFHTNYTALVNKYRIEEAMTLLADKRFQDLGMEAIADMVGFSSRQSFYSSFFRINKCTPREYRVKFLGSKTKKATRKPAEPEEQHLPHTQPNTPDCETEH